MPSTPEGPPWTSTSSGARSPSSYPTGRVSTPSIVSPPAEDVQLTTRCSPRAKESACGLISVRRRAENSSAGDTRTSGGVSGPWATKARREPPSLAEKPP